MEDWGAVRGRLKEDVYAAGDGDGALVEVFADDIRAALERVEELTRERDEARAFAEREMVRAEAWVIAANDREMDAIHARALAEAEVERLKQEGEEDHLAHEEMVAAVEKQRDAALAEVARLEGLILAARDSEDTYGLESEALWSECARIRAQREEGKL